MNAPNEPEIPTAEQQAQLDQLAVLWPHTRVGRTVPMGTLCLDVDVWPVGVPVDREGVPTVAPELRYRVQPDGGCYPLGLGGRGTAQPGEQVRP